MNNPSSHRAVEAHYHQLSDAEMARIGGSEGEAEIGAVVGEVLVASGPAAPELAVVIGCAIIGYEVEKMLDGGIDAANALFQEFTTWVDAEATQQRIDQANGNSQPSQWGLPDGQTWTEAGYGT
jgi:hypothetical protein